MVLKIMGITALVLLTSCAAYVDSRVESVLLEALPKVLGPAASYNVLVTGSSAAADYFQKVHVEGRRVSRSNAPVLEEVSLDLQDVTVDRQNKQLKSVRDARGQVRVLPADLAGYLQQRGWIDNPVVRFVPPDRIVMTGIPKVAGVAVPVRGNAEFQGRLVAQGAQLQLSVDYLRIAGVETPLLVRTLLQSTLNPVLNLSPYKVPAQIDSVVIDGNSMLVSASGSTF